MGDLNRLIRTGHIYIISLINTPLTRMKSLFLINALIIFLCKWPNYHKHFPLFWGGFLQFTSYCIFTYPSQYSHNFSYTRCYFLITWHSICITCLKTVLLNFPLSYDFLRVLAFYKHQYTSIYRLFNLPILLCLY